MNISRKKYATNYSLNSDQFIYFPQLFNYKVDNVCLYVMYRLSQMYEFWS